MSMNSDPSSNLWAPQGLPCRFQHVTVTGSSETIGFGLPVATDGGGVLLGVDVVAAHDQPVQCFVEMQLPTGISFYYDSQSTGEGNGVRFNYRGQIPFKQPEVGRVLLSSSASIDWYVVAWGLIVPSPMVLG